MRWLPPNYLPLLPFSILEGRLLLKVSFPKLLRTTIGYASELCQSLSGISISEADASLLVTDKCKIISFPFGSNPTSPVGHTIMHRYSVLALITTGKPTMFRPNWNVHINNRAMNPSSLESCFCINVIFTI